MTFDNLTDEEINEQIEFCEKNRWEIKKSRKELDKREESNESLLWGLNNEIYRRNSIAGKCFKRECNGDIIYLYVVKPYYDENGDYTLKEVCIIVIDDDHKGMYGDACSSSPLYGIKMIHVRRDLLEECCTEISQEEYMKHYNKVMDKITQGIDWKENA